MAEKIEDSGRYQIRSLLDLIASKKLDLSPPYQRRSIWNDTQRKLLIDSLLREIPLPVIYLREVLEGDGDVHRRYQVVDGKQRIITICSFVKPTLLPDSERQEFVIGEVDLFPELVGKSFGDLDQQQQELIRGAEIFIEVLPSVLHDAQVHTIFNRINSTGAEVKPQELRNAQFDGEFITEQEYLAGRFYQDLVNWGLLTPRKIQRMLDIEFVSELSLYLIDGHTSRRQEDLDARFLEMDRTYPEKEWVRQHFFDTMKILHNVLPYVGEKYSKKREILYFIFCAVYEKYTKAGNAQNAVQNAQIVGSALLATCIRVVDEGFIPKNAGARFTTQGTKSRQGFIRYFVRRLPTI